MNCPYQPIAAIMMAVGNVLNLEGLWMAYETLYRKYRPRHFKEVVGQKHVVRALQNALATKRLAHAYLFSGQRGTGKTTMARLLAMALNCERGVTPDPCGTCSACESIVKGNAMDVLEIDAASHTGVDAVREVIIERVSFLPASLRYRVYIIDEVHMLSQSAFNALLKTLEEPPPQVIFVLATTDPNKVPPTVRSRCLRFDFHPVATKDIADRLAAVSEREGWQGRFDPAALTLIARAARGSLRDALTMLEQAMNFAEDTLTTDLVRFLLGATDDEFLGRLVDALHDGDIPALWRLVAEGVETGRDLHQLAHDFAAYLRDLLSFKVGAMADELDERQALLRQQAPLFDEATLLQMVRMAWELERDLRSASDVQLALEIGLLSLARAAQTPTAEGHPDIAPAKATAAIPPAPVGSAPSPGSGQTPESMPLHVPLPGEAASRFTHIRQHWGIFLERLRRESIVAYTFLLNAEPTALDGDQLVLTFQHIFSYECASDRTYRETVERLLQDVFQMPQLKVKPVLSSQVTPPPVGEPVGAGTAESQAPPQVDTESFLQSLFDTS